MRKLLVSVALAAASIVTLPVHALSNTSDPFNVVVTLTAGCQFNTPSALNVSYTGFGAATEGENSFTVVCSQGLSYTLALDTANANTLGLLIPLSILTSPGNAAVGTVVQGATATPSSYKVKANIASGQQGNCATTAVCTSTVVRTLTVSY